MKPTRLAGLFTDRGRIWTRNHVPGRRVYGERLRPFRGDEYRDWSPYRSKLAALATIDHKTPWPDTEADLLYLGASSGTTVSHLSDLMGEGRVFAVEFSPRSVRDLIHNVEPRPNVVPILDDAAHPERYMPYLDRPVGTLVQDVAQRHQVEIFLRNVPLLRPGGLGFLFVKARSVDVASEPKVIYKRVAAALAEAGLEVLRQTDLEPFERDHRAFVVRRP